MIRFPKCRKLAFFTDTSICTAAKRAKLPASNGTSWNPIPTIGPAIATTTQAIFLPTTGGHVKFIERFRKRTPWIFRLHKPLMRCSKNRKPANVLFMSDQCKHCRTSPCHEACPTGAIVRNEFGGSLLIRPIFCMGCGMCRCSLPLRPDSFTGNQSEKPATP